jgi:hypothetical protein
VTRAGRTIPLEAARYRALAACGSALIAFIGVCHGLVGVALFPWGPNYVGGALPWHALGIFVIAAGLSVLAGTLGLIRFPVVPFALVAAVLGAFFVVVAAVRHAQFHLFAATGSLAGMLTAYAHRRAERLTSG